MYLLSLGGTYSTQRVVGTVKGIGFWDEVGLYVKCVFGGEGNGGCTASDYLSVWQRLM